MGLAAINSVLNAPRSVWANCAERLSETGADVFVYMRDRMRGKNAAVIGHFLGLERVAEICNLSILERRPNRAPLPDSRASICLTRPCRDSSHSLVA